MKALKNILGLLPVAAALMLTACSSDDNMTENAKTPAEPTAETKGIPFTVTVSTGEAATRAELVNYKDPSATTTYLQALNFATGDRLYITSTKGHGVLTLKDGAGTNTATFEGTLSETPDADTELTATLVSQDQFSSIGQSYAYVTVDANDAGDENGGQTAEQIFATWASSKAVTGISATATTGWRIPAHPDFSVADLHRPA